MRVAAALSGGVDSAVAAARAVDAGHEVTGVHLALARRRASYRTGARGCCTIEDAHDARRAADVLGIPFYVWDVSERFESDVVDDFLAEYGAGRTPNPCIRCNERIKFAAVLDRAVGLGFDAVATGHYARLIPASGGVVELHRAVDAAKDQSYVLGVLTQDQLRHCLFSLGGSSKEAVRAEARVRRLAVADKPDSTDICFIPDGDTAGWLRQRLGASAGEVVDESGSVVGRHHGAYAFTVGQRRGLRLDRPAADGRARYVLDIEPVSGRVTVGPREQLAVDRITAIRPRWCADAPERSFAASVQLRAHAAALPSRIVVEGGQVEALLDEPTLAVAPGQTMVVYDGTRVMGAATVAATRRCADAASTAGRP